MAKMAKKAKMTVMAAALAGIGLAGCSQTEDEILLNGVAVTQATWTYSGQVQVMGRSWAILRKAKNVNSVRVIRDNNNLNPFGGPAVRRSVQAARAIEQGTGCKIIASTFKEHISGEFYADIVCRYRSET